MTKFGELIFVNRPVLINFYIEQHGLVDDVSFLREVVTTLGSQAKVVKMNIRENESLTDALRITEAPTFVIYKNGEMKWRRGGKLDANRLIQQLKKYL